MIKIFALYNLKKGVSMETYRKWSREQDQRITPHLPGVIRFEVYEMKGAQKGQSPYQIVEDAEVESWEEWLKLPAREEMKGLIQTFPELVDVDNMIMIYGEKV